MERHVDDSSTIDLPDFSQYYNHQKESSSICSENTKNATVASQSSVVSSNDVEILWKKFIFSDNASQISFVSSRRLISSERLEIFLSSKPSENVLENFVHSEQSAVSHSPQDQLDKDKKAFLSKSSSLFERQTDMNHAEHIRKASSLGNSGTRTVSVAIRTSEAQPALNTADVNCIGENKAQEPCLCTVYLFDDLLLWTSAKEVNSEKDETVCGYLYFLPDIRIEELTIHNLLASIESSSEKINETAMSPSIKQSYRLSSGNDFVEFGLYVGSDNFNDMARLLDFVFTLVQTLFKDDEIDINGKSEYLNIQKIVNMHKKVKNSLFARVISDDPSSLDTVFNSISGRGLVISFYLDHQVDFVQATLLHCACFCGSIGTVKVLLHRGILFEAADENMMSPLHYAAVSLDADNLELLLESSMSISHNVAIQPMVNELFLVNQLDIDDRTPLFIAVLSYLELCERSGCCSNSSSMFISSSIGSADAVNSEKQTTLKDEDNHIFINLKKVLAVLARFQANFDLADSNGDTPLLLSVKADDILLATALLNYGANPDFLGGNSLQTPLQWIYSQSNYSLPMINLLINWGANPSQPATTSAPTEYNKAQEGSRTTLLHQLFNSIKTQPVSNEVVGAAVVLAGYGGRIDLKDNEGRTVSSIAALFNVDLAGAANAFKVKAEPRKTIEKLKQFSIYSLPVAKEKQEPTFSPADETLPNNSLFSSIALGDLGKRGVCSVCKRRLKLGLFSGTGIECSYCNSFCCQNCCYKKFTLCHRSDHNGSETPELKLCKVCTPCFNNLSRIVLECGSQMKESKEVMGVRNETEENQRNILFGSALSSVLNTKDHGSSVSTVTNDIHQAKENIILRGEKLNRLAVKAEKLRDTSENFGSLATQIRRKEESKNFLGFF